MDEIVPVRRNETTRIQFLYKKFLCTLPLIGDSGWIWQTGNESNPFTFQITTEGWDSIYDLGMAVQLDHLHFQVSLIYWDPWWNISTEIIGQLFGTIASERFSKNPDHYVQIKYLNSFQCTTVSSFVLYSWRPLIFQAGTWTQTRNERSRMEHQSPVNLFNRLFVVNWKFTSGD